MSLSETVFTWSTPAPALDGSAIEPWRVSRSAALASHLASTGYPDSVAYVERDGDALWVGLRDNRVPDQHERGLLLLADQLRAEGLTIRAVKREGRVTGLRVIDRLRGTRLPLARGEA